MLTGTGQFLTHPRPKTMRLPVSTFAALLRIPFPMRHSNCGLFLSAVLSPRQKQSTAYDSSVGTGSGRVSAWGQAGLRRPTCAFALEAAKSGAPRFLADNILALELEAPVRTTCDLGNPHAQVCMHMTCHENA